MHISLLLGLGAVLQTYARPLDKDSFTERSHPSLPRCANDHVWGLFEGTELRAEASAFCSTYIEKTQTHISTVHPMTTKTEPAVTITVATHHVTVTDTSVVHHTITSWSTSTKNIPATVTRVVDDVVLVTDVVTTTDTTLLSTVTDDITTTVTDATIYNTVFITDDITTTYATVYATQTAIEDITLTDATMTSTATILATVTAAADLESRGIQAKEVKVEEKDSRGRCISPACLHTSWLDNIHTIEARLLSSACSCLVEPSTIIKTVTKTGNKVTRTIVPTARVTATDHITKVITHISTDVVVKTTVIDKPSDIFVTVTDTVTSTTTDFVDATAHSTETVIAVTTIDETATATRTVVTSLTIDETASSTATITDTVTIDETASTTVTVTETTTETAAASVQTGNCDSLSNPYTNSAGQEFTLDCGHYYPVQSGGSVASFTVSYFSECLDKCTEYSTCVGVDFDSSSGYCELFNSAHDSAAVAYDSALIVTVSVI
ncbi:hypothetical protein N7493_002307 [Penicillium malachiteum]|uniref:Apple domain-containing protein n=1 Tax=Penicillium malachiteum TaxID=1324776 RepID=A0AAD6HS53_9EURO|nr:hypothetical protein N7493_002307 [Penicillium malachiteum]